MKSRISAKKKIWDIIVSDRRFLLTGLMLCYFLSGTCSVWASDHHATWKEFFSGSEGYRMEISKEMSMGAMVQNGVAVFESGEIAQLKTWFTYESEKGLSKYEGYVLYTFPDGSTKLGRIEGEGKVPGLQQGKLKLISGTGRFEGVQGNGVFTANTPFISRGMDTYCDVEATYSILEK